MNPLMNGTYKRKLQHPEVFVEERAGAVDLVSSTMGREFDSHKGPSKFFSSSLLEIILAPPLWLIIGW